MVIQFSLLLLKIKTKLFKLIRLLLLAYDQFILLHVPIIEQNIISSIQYTSIYDMNSCPYEYITILI